MQVKCKSEIKELETEEQAGFIQNNVEFIGNESIDIQPIVEAKEKRDMDASPKETELKVSQTMMKENTPRKKKEAKKKNQPKKKNKSEPEKKIERRKCITPVSSPEFIHVPSTAEKRREAKVARNKHFLRERGLDLSISELSKLYNNNNNIKKLKKHTMWRR